MSETVNPMKSFVPVSAFVLLVIFSGCASEPKIVPDSGERYTVDETPVVIGPKLVLGKQDRLPEPITRTAPVYPESCKTAGITGTVIVEFIINKYGNVVSAHTLKSPDARLSAAAEAAIMQWKFKPALKNGVPRAVKMQFPVEFALQDIKSEVPS